MFPVSIKGVLILPGKEVVLALNSRDEWELPGGRIEVEETSECCLEREFWEELSVNIYVKAIIDTYLFEVVPRKHVFIATYGCDVLDGFNPVVSNEHERIATFPVDALPVNLPASYAKSIHAWCSMLSE